MGSNCSSRQAHKDKDSHSPCSEESPCYQQAKLENNANEVKNSLRGDGVGGGSVHPDDGRNTASAVPNKTNNSQSKLASKEEKRPIEPPLPAELLKFPSHLANLLTGRTLDAKPNKRTHKIALYVCAADSQDCCVEKGTLHNVVYPELRALCRGSGYELHIVDLHWKTALEKQQDHEFPELCVGELTRQSEIAYVIPIIFLNDSLGTPLLPKTIEKQDFEFALNSADNKELLQKWYKLDSHAQPPCYRLQPIGSHIPGFKDEAENESALNEWRLEIERILAVMVEVFPPELRDSYLTTVVEQEVHNTVLMSQELAKRCMWVWRSAASADANDADSTGLQEQRRRLEILQNNLRGQLADKHIMRVQPKEGIVVGSDEHKQYTQDLAEKLDAHLRTTVTQIIAEDLAKEPLKPCLGVDGELFHELVQQANYCQRAAQCNINREEVLQHIQSYILENSTTPLVLYGPKGCGKSALVAKAFQAIKTWQPDAFKMIRFTGLTPASGTMEQLLLSIVSQCSVLAGGEPWHCPHNEPSYAEILPKLMAAACTNAPLIIIIDGIDQVRKFGCQSCEWLPENLPENLKLILSVDESSDMFETIKTKISDHSKFVKVPQLGRTEAKSILMSAVVQYNHSINKQIQDFVRNSVMECTLPLYIKILSWQTSLWVDKEHTIVPKGNVKDQFNALLEELEAILGQVRMKGALSLIYASKFGLCDSEMLDLLAQDSIYHSSKTYVPWAPACLFWAQLNKYLAPFLEWTRVTGGYCVRRWRDISFQEAVKDRYMSEETTKEAHRKLEAYFKGEWIETRGLRARLIQQPNKDMDYYNIRKLVELPYQTFMVTGDITEHFLLNVYWLLDKVCGADVYQTLEDFALGANEEAAALGRCLEESGRALGYDGRQLFAQLHHRLSHISLEGLPRLQALLELSAAPPIASLLPLGPTKASEEPQAISLITRLPDLTRFVCTLATEKGEIAVWDVCTGRCVRTLSNVPQPAAIKLIDWRRCIVLCRRELTVFDLDKGMLVKRLKGVMNQKMPYFGLHDDQHLVALSRNRMYVNLMNTETGDCVTTFKAGEDRFLDSLLVSKDGRILVCGDETQKPFPLLVWSLTSRKLMYDLRIPHHDFITSLAAITDEGHYVCSVCKEVDEPSPNFIIVYDLQSGTLFKKWKPGVNTVSIAISSSQDKFVISGHEDAQILVWDLTTGNCRHTLSGHTAPVTMLRLDSSGSFFLSADSMCRDRSLRLWNLSSGTCLAVFTPDFPFTACELANGGRAVILALKGHSGILTLHLRSGQEEERSQEQTYGDPGLDGEVVTLNDEDFR